MITVTGFGTLPDGREVSRFTLANECGVQVALLNYGGILQALWVPDREGRPGNVVLGYDSLSAYEANPAYLGAVIGRAAGRLRGGVLPLEGRTYPLAANSGANTLHGGPQGFHRKWMAAETQETDEALALVLRFESPDGEGGFPGNLDVTLTYRLQRCAPVLQLEMAAVSDRRTYLNMTHHGYFNLSGGERPVTDQQLALQADAYAPVDQDMLPCEGWQPVAGLPFDLRTPVRLAEPLASTHAQIQRAGGIDHPFRLVRSTDSGVEPCAWLTDAVTGRRMTVSTDQPHLVVYTGNTLQDAVLEGGCPFGRHQGICFEAQEVPDAPGSPFFPCRLLEPGKRYQRQLRYDFDTLST